MSQNECETYLLEQSSFGHRSTSAAMSFGLLTIQKRFRERFLGRFPENNIWFVVYPFFKIFKFCGFLPLKLSLEKYPELVFRRDREACFLTIAGLVGVTIGFGYGVHILGQYESLGLHKTSTIISYVTSWVQIYSLFLQGIIAVVTSWTNLTKMGKLIAKVRHIDFALEMAGVEVSYRAMRKRLFIQSAVSLVIPTCLSMVNCIMIKRPFEVSHSCYWFICFTPLLFLTIKELQFYNLLFLLKLKFDAVNQQLADLAENKLNQNGSLSVISKSSSGNVLLVRKDRKLTEQIRALAEIYSNAADCVDKVMIIFSSHLLTTTCTSFAVITIQTYNLFSMVMHSLSMQIHEIVFTVAWIVVQILTIGVNVVGCSQTSNAMADTGTFLHKLKPRDEFGVFLQMVQVFSLEILHRKKPLTAAGFFDMNFKLFTSIVAAVTTYLIIIIQFHLANLQLISSGRNQTNS